MLSSKKNWFKLTLEFLIKFTIITNFLAFLLLLFLNFYLLDLDSDPGEKMNADPDPQLCKRQLKKLKLLVKWQLCWRYSCWVGFSSLSKESSLLCSSCCSSSDSLLTLAYTMISRSRQELENDIMIYTGSLNLKSADTDRAIFLVRKTLMKTVSSFNLKCSEKQINNFNNNE